MADEERQKRYNEYIEKVTNKKTTSSITSSICRSGFGSTLGLNSTTHYRHNQNSASNNAASSNQNQDANPLYCTTNSSCAPSTLNINNSQKQGLMNHPLNTNCFYGPGSINNRVSQLGANSDCGASSTSLFKMPQPTKEFSLWKKYDDDLNNFINLLRNQIHNKETIKLFKNFVSIFARQAFENEDVIYDPMVFAQNCTDILKSKYYAKRCPSSLSIVSSRIDSTTNIQYDQSKICPPPHSIVSSRLDEQNSTTNIQYNQLLRQDQPYRHPTQYSSQQQEQQQQQKEDTVQYLNPLPDESLAGLSLFSDTLQAQYRDEQMAKQDTTVIKQPRGRPKAPVSRTKAPPKRKSLKSTITPETPALSTENITALKEKSGGKAVSRTGRIIKSPVQYWKGNESKVNDSVINFKKNSNSRNKENKKEVDLNETMTLRSNKVVERSITKGRKSTPLSSINEIPKTNNKQIAVKNNKVTKKQDKENEINNCVPKQIRKRVHTNTKKAATSKKVETKEKEPRKRKSKDASDSLSKRKKVEENSHIDSIDKYGEFSEDELFGNISFKKRPNALQALSPTKMQSMSIQKALVSSMSRETPPCKTLGDMMERSSHSGASQSSVKQLPDSKANRVVKRVTKVTESKTKKPDVSKLDNKVSQGSYTTTTPLSQNAIFTMFSSVEDVDSDGSCSVEDGDLDDDLI